MIQTALKEIKKGISEIIDEKNIIKLLENYYQNNKTYLVKAGFDPTATDLHLGHTVLLQKLATFQKYGGHIQFLIGDFTAMIGDPTGKSETRKVLNRDTILENAQTYTQQVFKILDPDKTTVMFNSKWLDTLGSSGLIALSTQHTVARMLERDDFDKRYKSNSPIAVSEFLYPLLQGYDSVEMKSDIEVGGIDQKFNLIMGRHLQRAYNVGKEQSILMMPILEGLDGVAKMSKSLNNFISIKEPKNEMFAKIMSISDDLMWIYYDLLSDKTTDEVTRLKNSVKDGTFHPKKAKEQLGIEIVNRFHCDSSGESARDEFNKVFSENSIPSDIETISFNEDIWIVKAITSSSINLSSSEIRRLIKQGGLRVNNDKMMDESLTLSKGSYTIKVGKKKFLKVEVV